MRGEQLQKRAMTVEEACNTYGLNRGTLANYRSTGKGPRFYRVGRKILYTVSDLESWILSNPTETSDSIRG